MDDKCKIYQNMEWIHIWKSGKEICQCGMKRLEDDKDSSISYKVYEMEQDYEAMKFLAGEMIATLIIQNNKKLFDHMPPEWFSVVKNWEEKFREIAKRSNS